MITILETKEERKKAVKACKDVLIYVPCVEAHINISKKNAVVVAEIADASVFFCFDAERNEVRIG